MNLIPTVIETTNKGECAFDIFSRLLKDRIIFIGGEINDSLASSVIAQLLYLEAQAPGEDISLYINSPGGSVSAGLAVFDTMNYIKCDVSTICVGMAASMGAFLLAGGAKGKRFSLPNADIMLHQPLGSTEGQAEDVRIAAEHLLKTREKLYKLLEQRLGCDEHSIARLCDRNRWFTPEEAMEHGLIDRVVTSRL